MSIYERKHMSHNKPIFNLYSLLLRDHTVVMCRWFIQVQIIIFCFILDYLKGLLSGNGLG